MGKAGSTEYGQKGPGSGSVLNKSDPERQCSYGLAFNKSLAEDVGDQSGGTQEKTLCPLRANGQSASWEEGAGGKTADRG